MNDTGVSILPKKLETLIGLQHWIIVIACTKMRISLKSELNQHKNSLIRTPILLLIMAGGLEGQISSV